MIRVLVAESAGPIREFLAGTLEGQCDLDLVALCSDASELRAALRASEPDVLIIDTRISPALGEEGLKIARRLRSEGTRTGVVVLGADAEPANVLAVVGSCPGRAYLRKERISRRSDLFAAISAVAEGGVYVDPGIVEAMIEARARVARSPLPRLSREERQLLALVAGGRRNDEIADALAAPADAIDGRCSTVFEKLGVSCPTDVCERVRAALTYLADEGD